MRHITGSLKVYLILALLVTPLTGASVMEINGVLDPPPGSSRVGPIMIRNVRDLQNMSSDLFGDYILANDMNVSATRTWNLGAGFVPVGTGSDPFRGTFEGNHHTITGLYINRSNTEYVGLFGKYFEAYGNKCVANVSLIDCSIKGKNYVGSLAGYYAAGEAHNCHCTGEVNGENYVGGLVGFNHDTLSNCSSSGNVSGRESVGGLVGLHNAHTISVCCSSSNVTAINYTGGLVGRNLGSIYNCHASGNVTGNSWVGGILGDNDRTLSNSYSVGEVKGKGFNIGGLVGLNYYATVSDCFWDVNTSGRNTSQGGTGKTTEEMMNSSTFTDAGWDMSKIWWIMENETYPHLVWEDRTPPVASAGDDRIVDEGTSVVFNGSGSRDDIGIIGHTWKFHDGGPVTLHGIHPTYRFDDPGRFTVELNTTDRGRNFDTDIMNVTVRDITPPQAEPGFDRMIDQGTNLTFNASGSSDNVGIENYTWTFQDQGPVALYGKEPTYTFENAGTFEVLLNVTDATGLWDTGQVTVIVRDTTPPVADAGPDQRAAIGEKVRFNGSESSDNVWISTYRWTFNRSGVEVTLSGKGPWYVFEEMGIYEVELCVMDLAGNSGEDTMYVDVVDLTLPVADAGPDRNIEEDTWFSFDGRASADNVGISNYTWTFTDQGAPISLWGPGPNYMFSEPGVYTVHLKVRDSSGNQDTDTITVHVTDMTHPVADAGPDRTVDQFTEVEFNGEGSRDNVGVSSFTWTMTNGGSIELKGPRPRHRFSDPGEYQVKLTVRDPSGLSDTDTMVLIVEDIIPPSADSGPDRNVSIGTTVKLKGTLSSDNHRITGYFWYFEYGGERRELNGEIASFTFREEGIYKITLKVEDHFQNHDADTMVLRVIATGTVWGTVLDDKGSPVSGASVIITSSQGIEHSATTDRNGSFSLDVFHGNFTWKISKEGYGTISGSSRVGPMERAEIGPSEGVLERKRDATGALFITMLILVLTAIILGAAVFLITRKREGTTKLTVSKEDD